MSTSNLSTGELQSVQGESTTDKVFGELVPAGGGDPIPLLKKTLLIGRREQCDIVLRFKNVSAHHCQLTVRGGFWYIRDLESLNGTKVNDVAVTEKRINPGDRIAIAKHRYKIAYTPSDLGAVGPPPPDEPVDNILNQSLLQRAGLEKKRRTRRPTSQRIDITDDSANQLKKPSED
ncbi:MAG TPA: FHA domain-containing protein [Pirellulales bacterium]|nr:FHA domain-containing protein [Pirellulales bacterium]